ncbi:endo-1,4-beta-xylanase [Myxosarcina sp. GI1]|uniref:endo-1,4-beta-xylanase n=1 Tax=Myxosarcina sp. GI1 TaxID=1541065 RepID=UPI000691A898|nr:endo-1,4-beta-xylanase [Myxosarcina sp. GI1]
MTNREQKIRRRSLLLGLSALGVTHCVNLAKDYRTSEVEIQQSSEYLDTIASFESTKSLQQLAASKGLIYGAYPQKSYANFVGGKPFKSTYIRECALLVAGFFGVSVGPVSKNTYNFREADSFFNFAVRHKKRFRGHPLIWNEFNSPWLVNKFNASSTTSSDIEAILIDSIETMVGRYKGQVHSWDVVNEIINPDDGRTDDLKDTLKSGIRGEYYRSWLHFLGPNYIDLAFRVAAKADPKTMLTYNDNSIVYDFNWQERRRRAVLNTLEKLKANGTPIHAFGIQSHLNASWNQNFNERKFRDFLSDIASLGLKIIISELDVMDHELPGNISIRDRRVARAYYQYLSVALDEPAVISVINWGLSDKFTWLSYFSPRADGKPVRPLPYNKYMRRKRAWQAIARAFSEAPKRPKHEQFDLIPQSKIG